MQVDNVIRDERKALQQILRALTNNLTARDNLGGEAPAGLILTSNGPDSPPSFKPIGAVLGVPFDSITNLPNTLAGYGIQDAFTMAQIFAFLAGKSDLGHTHALDNLSDVAAPAPADGDVLTWFAAGGFWIATTNTPALNLRELLDVLLPPGIPDGDILMWNNALGKWVNASPSAGTVNIKETIVNVPVPTASRASVVVADGSIGAGSQLLVNWGAVTETDDNTPETSNIGMHAIPGVGQMTVVLSALDIEPLFGDYRLNYLIG